VTIFDPGLVASGLASFRLLSGGGTSNTLTVNGGSFNFDTAAAENANLTLNVNTDSAGAAGIVVNATQHLAALNIGVEGGSLWPRQTRFWSPRRCRLRSAANST